MQTVCKKEIIRHIRDMHCHFSSPVRCGVENCPSTATSYESLRQHMYKKHRNELIPEDYNNPTSTKAHDISDEHDRHDHDPNVADEVDTSIPGINDNMSQSTIETAKFILKI